MNYKDFITAIILLIIGIYIIYFLIRNEMKIIKNKKSEQYPKTNYIPVAKVLAPAPESSPFASDIISATKDACDNCTDCTCDITQSIPYADIDDEPKLSRWFNIDEDGQPPQLGYWDVLYSYEIYANEYANETSDYWPTRYYWDGKRWSMDKSGGEVIFGNRNTKGERYRGLAEDPSLKATQ